MDPDLGEDAGSGGIGIGSGEKGRVGVEEEEEVWDFGVDDKRGWVIAVGWLVASAVE